MIEPDATNETGDLAKTWIAIGITLQREGRPGNIVLEITLDKPAEWVDGGRNSVIPLFQACNVHFVARKRMISTIDPASLAPLHISEAVVVNILIRPPLETS